MFKQLHINNPIVEALEQKKLEELSSIILNEECLAIIQNEFPRKIGDPRSFTIPCTIGPLSIGKALVDLGCWYKSNALYFI